MLYWSGTSRALDAGCPATHVTCQENSHLGSQVAAVHNAHGLSMCTTVFPDTWQPGSYVTQEGNEGVLMIRGSFFSTNLASF